MNVLACSFLKFVAVLGEMPLDVPLQKQCEELKFSLHCFLQRIEEKGAVVKCGPSISLFAPYTALGVQLPYQLCVGICSGPGIWRARSFLRPEQH